MKSVITKSDNGVFSIRKSDVSEAGFEFVLSEQAFVLMEDSEFDFYLHSFNNGIVRTPFAVSFQLYDVNGKSAVLIEVKSYEQFSSSLSTEFISAEEIRFICQSLVHSKYPGIDINAFHVGDSHRPDALTVVIGSSSAVVEFEPNGD